jgi:transposase
VSACVGPDETGVSVDGEKNWIWTWQDRSLTYLACSESRGAKTIKEHFPHGFLNAVLVSDRWGAQLGTAAEGHQPCLAHILRDLDYIIGLGAGCTVAPRLKILLQKSIAHKKAHPESAMDNGACGSMEREMDQLLQEAVDKEKDPQTAKLQKSLLRHRGYLFRFLYHKEVPFDNNASERGIRMVKVKQKVSGGFKSLQNEFCIIKSVVDTAIKNGSSPFDTIKMAVANMAG